MDLRTGFTTWYFNEFHLTDLYKVMENTVENSPYHREVNVGIHTDMVVAQYIGAAPFEWDVNNLVGAFACAFHDVGKPDACEKNGIKFKPERGNYLSFGGHELMSARLWEDFAVREWGRFRTLGLDYNDIYRVGWLIEHHLPWGIKKADKRHALAQTLCDTNMKGIFVDVLEADTWGRISDDGPEKKETVLAWIAEFSALVDACEKTPLVAKDQPTLYVPIGAPGSGKSTFRGPLTKLDSFSLDDLRMEWYGPPDCPDESPSAAEEYSFVFEKACDDKQFNSRANARYMEQIKTGKDLYVDNTNTSAKRRRFYVSEARKRGYFIQAILLPVELQEVLNRQKTRPDKDVPAHAVQRMYMGLQLPSYGDFDDVLVSPANL